MSTAPITPRTEFEALNTQLRELWNRLGQVTIQREESITTEVVALPRTRHLIAMLWLADCLHSEKLGDFAPAEVRLLLDGEMKAHFTATELRHLDEIKQLFGDVQDQLEQLRQGSWTPDIHGEEQLRDIIPHYIEAVGSDGFQMIKWGYPRPTPKQIAYADYLQIPLTDGMTKTDLQSAISAILNSKKPR